MIVKPILLSILLLSLSLEVTLAQNQETCQVLALAGGGDKGSYQAGAIQALVDYAKDPKNVQYDIVTGVSIGAINAAFFTQYSKGQEKEMADNLVSIWSSISSADIYKEYLGGIVYAVLFKSSIFTTDPGRSFLSKHITKPAARPLLIGTVNADTGEYVTFDENLSASDLVQAVLCSSAIPAIFPYQQFQGKTFIDGGTIRNLNIGGGINRCKSLGYNDSQIIVDVISLSSGSLDNLNIEGYTSLQVLIRTLEIISYKGDVGDIATAKLEFPHVNFRYLIMPSQKLPSGAIPIGFQPDQIATMIQVGAEDAISAIQLGEGVSFDRAIARATETAKRDGTFVDPVKFEDLKQKLKMNQK